MEGEPQQRPLRVSLGHRPTLCAGFLFPLAPNKKDAQRFLCRLIPYGGKDSVKENPHFIRAQTNPLRRLSAPLAPNKKDAIWRLFYLVGMTGFEPATSASRTQRSTKLSHIPLEKPSLLS